MIRKLAACLLLMALPAIAMKLVKQTSWGPILATPQARQTGDPKAKVVIVEYSDFQCPSCALVQPAIHDFLERYKGRIRLAYKYYPLTRIHKNAMPAARAAQCAAEENKFWPYQDLLFARQKLWANLSDPTTHFVAIAQEVKLNEARWRVCVADPGREVLILKDTEEAETRQVSSTPTFFVGEERLVGGVFSSDGARAIEKALRQ